MAISKKEKDLQQFLSVQLAIDWQAMIATDDLKEVMSIEISNIIPIPDMANAVIGICGHRGEVLWLIDLPCLLGLTPLYLANTRHVFNTVILRSGDRIAGFAVPQVGQMLSRQWSQLLRSPTDLPSRSLLTCVQGHYRAPGNQSLLVLDVAKLFDVLHAN